MEDPYYLSIEQIAGLTDAQIIGLYGRPRDKNGVPKKVGVHGQRNFKTPEELKKEYQGFMDMFRMFGG